MRGSNGREDWMDGWKPGLEGQEARVDRGIGWTGGRKIRFNWSIEWALGSFGRKHWVKYELLLLKQPIIRKVHRLREPLHARLIWKILPRRILRKQTSFRSGVFLMKMCCKELLTLSYIDVEASNAHWAKSLYPLVTLNAHRCLFPRSQHLSLSNSRLVFANIYTSRHEQFFLLIYYRFQE